MARVRQQINEGSAALKQIFINGLSEISDNLIDQIIKNYKSLPNSDKHKAINDISPVGIKQYSSDVWDAMVFLASRSLMEAQKEVPKATKYLAEKPSTIYKLFPTSIRKKIDMIHGLLINTQIADLEKGINFQYMNSYDTTDSIDQIKEDLKFSSEDYITGKSILVGATNISSKIVNEIRSAFFWEPETLEEIAAFQYVNGDPKTEICQDLNGTIFAKDDPNAFRYTPPLHWNCKSYIVPILSGNLKNRQITKLQPSTKELEDEIQF